MEHKCDICNKIFASRQSRWNHTKKFHTNDIYKNIHSNIQDDIHKCIYKCLKCDKEYKTYFVKWRHEKNCKSDTNNKNNILFDEKIKELEKKNQLEMEKFKNDLLKSLKIDKKELNKINNQLNLNQQNSNNNNNYYFQLGYEKF
jgi:hypothetical protein